MIELVNTIMEFFNQWYFIAVGVEKSKIASANRNLLSVKSDKRIKINIFIHKI